jgi:predicted nucleic acid-binding protein
LIVLDASVAVEVILRQPGAAAAAERLRGEDLHVPEVFDLEVLSALRSNLLAGKLSEHQAGRGAEDLDELRVTHYPHAGVRRRVWELRGQLTTYDAAYVALAESLGAPMVTLDARLGRAGGHEAEIEVLA